MRDLPHVVGGRLLEAVGGPLDGEILYLAHGECRINVGHFFDPQHTPWLGVRPSAPNHLGEYSPSAFVPGTLRWHACELQVDASKEG